MNRSNSIAIALLLASMAGCADMSDPAPATDAEEPQTTAEEPTADESTAFQATEVQASLDTYIRSLMDRDVNALSELVSSEIVARSVDRGISLEAFLEKQRRALLNTLNVTEADAPALDVVELFPAGDQAVRARLSFQGEPLQRDFYFVREDGAVKVNVVRPGFSKSLRSNSSYRVQNVNPGFEPSVTMQCNSGDVTTSGGQVAYITCSDNCGFWSGTTFRRLGGFKQLKCDWNTWGTDVWVDRLESDGWRCNDEC